LNERDVGRSSFGPGLSKAPTSSPTVGLSSMAPSEPPQLRQNARLETLARISQIPELFRDVSRQI